MPNLLARLFGDNKEREADKLRPVVAQINALEEKYRTLSPEALRAKTSEFRDRLARGESLDEILPEAYAAVREAGVRTIGQRAFDEQLLGAIVLHQGKIAEMKTGEGKTLTAAFPLYLNALTGKGAHLVTPNDYLSRIGGGWMGPIYHALGLSVGVITHDFSGLYDPTYVDTGANLEDERLVHWRACSRQEAYRADITYGTNNEFGFDYLRDNMVTDLAQCVQRELHYAIVDEVDNILIDEARTPLIISGPAPQDSQRYYEFARYVRNLNPETDLVEDPKHRIVTLTESGVEKLRRIGVPLPDFDRPEEENPEQAEIMHYLEQALKAQFVFHRDKDYVVMEGQVVIVDEHTGRLMHGRRWSDGLHEAVEAKEGLKIAERTQTMATITFQNYFRMYTKLAGMTGTALTEAEEFFKIYRLDVVPIPTHKPMIRVDYPDLVYKTEEAKFREVVREIWRLHLQDRPVLVGTIAIERSEILSQRMTAPALQKLARITLLRHVLFDWLEAHKSERQKYEEWTTCLNQPLDRLEPRLLDSIAKEVGINPSPLAAENLSLLAQIMEATDPGRLEATLRQGIPHQVLNAKLHEQEAMVIAQAGRPGTVTIATNMAGRGVDILLGGNPEGVAARRLSQQFVQTARGFVDSILSNNLSKASQIAAETPGLSPASIEEVRRLLALYQRHQAAEAGDTETPGDRSYLVDRLRALGHVSPGSERSVMALVNAIASDNFDAVREMQRLDPVVTETLVDAAKGAWRSFEEAETAVDYVVSQLLEAYYKPLLALIRLVLGRQEEKARALVQTTPVLSEKLIEEIQTIWSRWQSDQERVRQLGGLAIVGTERHEARRIDNQLRGRAGRQGDPGTSRFFVSLEDELMRRAGGGMVAGVMDRVGLEDDVPIESGLVSRAIEQAQVRMEGYNFDARKHIVQYDDVMNKQREVIYAERRKILASEDLSETILGFLQHEMERLVDLYLPGNDRDAWETDQLKEAVERLLAARLPADIFDHRPRPEILAQLQTWAEEQYERWQARMDEAPIVVGTPFGLIYGRSYLAAGRRGEGSLSAQIEKMLLLGVIDRLWVDHLTILDDLREGIGLRAVGQRDPLVEYKNEAYRMFQELTGNIERMTVQILFHIGLGVLTPRAPAGVRPSKKSPCWCGSGLPYFRCHGRKKKGEREALPHPTPALPGPGREPVAIPVRQQTPAAVREQANRAALKKKLKAKKRR